VPVPQVVELSWSEYIGKKDSSPSEGRWLLAVDPETLQAKLVCQHSDGHVPDVHGHEDLFPLSMIDERDDGFIEGGDWIVAYTPEKREYDGEYRNYWIWWLEQGDVSLDIQGTRNFLQMGRGDFEAGRESGNDYATCFFCQQCAEKHLKAYLAFHGKPVPRTHDAERLVELCSSIDPSFMVLKRDAGVLRPYGVRIRYESVRLRAEFEVGLVLGACIRIGKLVRAKLSELMPVQQIAWD
jgi:HEPN domain-containing protein